MDQNNLIDQHQLSKVIRGLELDLDRYETELAELNEQYKDMHEEKERFARETFYLHKKDEIVFVIDR